MRYVPALDGLRAVSVMLVFLFHRGGGHFPGGWIGVDIFFVLSGYLITSILVSEHEATGMISLRRFYLRRTRRLLPALAIVLCVAVGLAAWFHEKAFDTEIDAAAALFYVADYRYAFYPVYETALGHTWSLSVEEQFYLLWPALLIALLRGSRRLALGTTLVLITLVAVWRIFLFLVSGDPFDRIYFAFDARADELLIGCALAIWQPQISRFEFFRSLWPAVLLLLAFVVLTVNPEGSWLPYIDTVGYPLIGIGAGYLIIMLTSDGTNFLTRLLSLPIVVTFGRISYGFYLWHYLIMREQSHLFMNRIWLVFALSVLAAALSHVSIEQLFLNRGTRPAG